MSILSCSFFLSLWMFLSKGLYFFKIRSSNNKNIKISKQDVTLLLKEITKLIEKISDIQF